MSGRLEPFLKGVDRACKDFLKGVANCPMSKSQSKPAAGRRYKSKVQNVRGDAGLVVGGENDGQCSGYWTQVRVLL